MSDQLTTAGRLKMSRCFSTVLLALFFLKYGRCRPFSEKQHGLRQAPCCLHVNTSTHRIVDSLQRERYFHGVNVVVKGPPWMPNITGPFDPLWSFVDEDMQLLKDNGFNGMRYGMMWPGVESVRGKYNMEYIEAAQSVVKKVGKNYGIYTLLDMHQDLLSEKFCGEGIPDWAVNTGTARDFPWPLNSAYKVDPKTGYPTPQDCAKRSWGTYQFAEAAGVAYQNLYDNVNSTRDNCADFWATVAEAFADSPYIIGYDIINEPWAGDVFSDPLLLIPKVADQKNLAKFYEAIHTQLRKKDNYHNFFFESITWDETEVGFESLPGGDLYGNRSVISFHFYTPPELSRTLVFSARERDAKRLKCGSFLSEFSTMDEETMNIADDYLQSWLSWDYKGYVPITGSGGAFWFSNGTKNEKTLNIASRTYAQVVSGVTSKMHFDTTTKAFTLQYYITQTCMDYTTMIYLNEARHYSSGYTVEVLTSPNVGGISWSSLTKNYINVIHNSTIPEGTLITVNISKKQ